MSDYLHQIEERAEDARRNREMYSKDSRSRRITNEESAKDVPRLLAAIRAVEEAMDDLDDARAQGLVLTYGAIQYRVRHALTDALEGER